MNALGAYRGVLKELDKHESPTFSVDDFNWFFNESVDQYLTKNYEQGDVFEKELDDISVVIKDDISLTIDMGDSTLFSKPADYRHLLYMNVTAKANANYRRWKKDDQVTFVIRRQRTNRRGYQEDNAYDAPSEDNPQYRVSNEKLKVLIGANFTPLSAKLMYIRAPQVVYLNPDSSVDFNNPVNNTVIEFAEYAAKEIVRWCARVFLENIESNRYKTALNEQQIRKE